MIVRVAALISGLLGCYAPALAQESARERELATAYVLIDGPTSTAVGAGFAANMIATLDNVRSLSEEERAWIKTSYPLAETAAAAQFEGTVESRLIDAFVARFSEAELEELVAAQTFLRRPEIYSVLAGDFRSNPFVAVEMLRQNLTPEEFVKFTQTLGAPVTRAAAALTKDEAGRMRDDFRAAFDEALAAQCDTAPKGIAICDRQP